MYLDTANLEEIKSALRTGILRGVTTNPSILKKEKRARAEVLKDIVELGPKEVFAQVLGVTSEEMFEDYLKLKALGEEIGFKFSIKVPVCFEGLVAVQKIKEDDEDVVILGTAIYSSDQMIMATAAGCDMLAPYINRMQNNSIDSYEEIAKARAFIDDRGLKTEILGASFKNASQIVNCLTSGAHTCTIPYDLFVQLMNKDVSLKAIEVFDKDGKEFN